MKVIVGEHKCTIDKTPVNELEVNVTKVEFEFDEKIPASYAKKAFFTQGNVSKEVLLENNECDIPSEVLYQKGQVRLGVIAYEVQNGELIERFNPTPTYFPVWEGSLTEADNTEPITPTDKEQIESAIANIQAEQATQNEGISQNTSNITSLSESKQDKLISGQNIKTINNESLLGAGNLEVITDLSDYYTKEQTDNLLDDKADKSEIPDVSDFITKDVDNLTNYTKTNDMNTAINTAVGNERTSRESSDVALQNQIDAITASSDVVDVVSTYQDLLNYSTASLTEDDIIKVMQDESHSNAISYFRWQLSTWNYIGSEGPFYTKGETDTLLNNKANVSDLPDLTDYVKNTDYANDSKGGTIKVGTNLGTNVDTNGFLTGITKTYTDYTSGYNSQFISKGTLENVITGKQLINQPTLNESQAEQDTTIEGLQAELERYKMLENALPHTENETASDYVTLENTAKSPMEVSLTPQTSQETTSGKNLFNVNTTNENKYIDGTNGNLYDSTSSNSSDFIEIKSNSNYTLSFDYTSLLSSNTRTICFYNFDKQRISHITYDPTYKSFNTVTPENAYYVRFTYDKNCFNVQFEEGSTATSYEPYTGGIPAPNPDFPMDIHRTTGENEIEVYGETYTKNATWNAGYLNSSNEIVSSGSWKYSDYIDIEGATDYYVNGSGNSPKSILYDTNKNVLQVLSITNDPHYDLTQYNAKYIRISTTNEAINDQKVYQKTTYPISLGTKEMFNINDVYDGFVYDETTDKFYIERKNGKVVFTGEEFWRRNSDYRFYLAKNDFSQIFGNPPKASGDCLSNYFKKSSSYQSNSIYIGTSSAIGLQNDLTETLTDLYSWLSTHNTTFVYELETPILEEITDTTLVSQLRAIKNTLSMQGSTHIISTSSGTNLPFLIKARAVQNISNS